MPEFEPPECDAGHRSARMSFLEASDPLNQGNCGIGSGCSEWQKRWRYACPECGRIIEILETLDGFEERTVRDSDERQTTDPTSLNPLRE